MQDSVIGICPKQGTKSQDVLSSFTSFYDIPKQHELYWCTSTTIGWITMQFYQVFLNTDDEDKWFLL